MVFQVKNQSFCIPRKNITANIFDKNCVFCKQIRRSLWKMSMFIYNLFKKAIKMFVQENCFQRQTTILGEAKTRKQIVQIYDISNEIGNHEYERALQLINKFYETFQFEEDSLYYEFQLMEAFCKFQVKDLQKTKQICQGIFDQLGDQQNQVKKRNVRLNNSQNLSATVLENQLRRSFSVRFYTFVIVLCIESYNIGIEANIVLERLIDILKVDKCIYLPEVLGILTGCRSFKNIHKVNSLNGEPNRRKAKKLEILSLWKYLIHQNNECLRFKKQALTIWRKENLLKQKEKCEQQLKQLMQHASNPKIKGKFVKKLIRMDFFIHELRKLQNQEQKVINKQTNIKLCFPILLSDLYQQEEEKKKEGQSLSQSKFVRGNDKRNELAEVIQKNEQFFQAYKKQKNNQVTSLIFNSKFIDQKVRFIRKKLLIMFTIRKYAFRLAFPLIKECAIARSKRLGKSKMI